MTKLYSFLEATLILAFSILALLLITASSSFADERVTKMMWGCEWVQGLNGNYWSRVNGGCPIHKALGYSSANEMRGKDVLPATEDDSEEPSDPGEGPGDVGDNGTDPGDNGGDNGGGNEGPGTEGPSKPGHGHGDDNHDHSGPPGKGKGKGRA